VADLTIPERLAFGLTAAHAGVFIQWKFRVGTKTDILASYGPDINSVADVPSALMPAWAAHLIAAMTDYSEPNALTPLALKLNAILTANPTGAQWATAKTAFLASLHTMARTAATSIQPKPYPRYWKMILALNAKTPLATIHRTSAQAGAARGRGVASAWDTRTPAPPRAPGVPPMGQTEELSAKYAARCLARVLLWSLSAGDDSVARAFGAFTRASVAAQGFPEGSAGKTLPMVTMRVFRGIATAQAVTALWGAL
jgi:hypothetical protein